MKILIADDNHPILHQLLQASAHQCDLFYSKTVDELIALLPLYDALVIRSKFKITKELLIDCPRLKCIGRVGAGMENIDLSQAKLQNIMCVNAPEGNRDAVGEHALGMLLMLLNRLKIADSEVRNGIWKRAENRGTEIKNKTIGIIGYGHMGSAFAEKLKGFGCNVLAYDKYKKDFGNDFVKEVTLQSLFENADVVSLHLPLNEETNYFLNSEFINSFRKPFYLLNTARGKCVNIEELVEALKTGKILGACLDVLEYETTSFEKVDARTPPPLAYLLQSDKVILTPHIAGWTHESNYKMSKIIAERMIEVLREE
jgi:D-3-phosphoglycerate dehydrogenase / 2-oxoglutarate reductase